MTQSRTPLVPSTPTQRMVRPRLALTSELALAFLPSITVLLVFAFVVVLREHHLLFASLASRAFLIYLDPRHATNSTRTLAIAQVSAAVIGGATCHVFGPGYIAGGVTMVAIILVMILLDTMHPPAVATALGFGFRAGPESTLVLFNLAIGVTVGLVLLQRSGLWVLPRVQTR